MMKSTFFLMFILSLMLGAIVSFGQPGDLKGFKMTGINPVKTELNRTITGNSELSPFAEGNKGIFGLSVSGKVTFGSDAGMVRIILVDREYREYLVYEMYSLLADNPEVSFDELCEETCLLDGVVPQYLRVEAEDAVLQLDRMTVASGIPPGISVAALNKEKHQVQNNAKIAKLNQNLQARGLLWAAGNTGVSDLSYAERKQLYGQSKIPAGVEYYVGGILQTGPQLKAATASQMVGYWDWRNRHGQSWLTPVKNQGGCGSCWAFAATGATEAQVNLYFNQSLNLDLSEQDILSCSGGGSCSGGYPSTALTYIKNTGIVDEAAFRYTATDQPCSNKSSNPSQLIKIAGKLDFGTTAFPRTEDDLKKAIIKYGPISGGIYDWTHAIVLAGWQVVKAGDRFFTRDLNKNVGWITVPSGSSLIGTTVWIYKNSWGSGWGDAGYVYVQTSLSNMGWTHALLNPVQSIKQTYNVVCEDKDGDGYYWWGLGTKPASCATCPDTPDGDDSNPNLGPLDAYGNCTVLGNAPVANFTADKTTINTGGSVSFTDLSTNAPASWSWTFEGGTPSSSTSQNPVVTYTAAGTYDVSLTVTNSHGSSTKTIADYITVNDYVPSYCSSHGNASKEYISKVVLNGLTSNSGSSGTTGYEDFTGSIHFSVVAGNNYSMSLTPTILSKSLSEGFSVWIDFNHDYDFTDAGEQVLTTTKAKSTVTKTITIPSTSLGGTTRMRVSMKRSAAPGSCDTGFNGEVEDYSIDISASAVKSASLSGDMIQDGIRVYPNPATEKLTIELGELYEGDICAIYNMQGMLISKMILVNNITQINVAGLIPGMYFYVINNGENRYTDKFIKQ